MNTLRAYPYPSLLVVPFLFALAFGPTVPATASPAGPEASEGAGVILVGLSADAAPEAVAAALGGRVVELVESDDRELRFASVLLAGAGAAQLPDSSKAALGILGVGSADEAVEWTPLQSGPPRDVFYTQQRGTHFGALGAEPAWTRSTGRTAVIGFVDTGADCSHPDLKGAWLDNESIQFPGVEFVSFDTVGAGATRYGGGCSDSVGHGTTTAGLAGARGDNNLGVAGMAYDARMIEAKALSAGAATTIDIIEAIILLTEWRVDVINMSLGTYTTRLGEASVERQAYDITSVCQALDWALRNGTASVAAAGNDGRRRVYYPAGCPATVGVGALAASSMTERWVGSSTAGSTTGPHVDVVAPGSQLFGIQGAPQRRGYGDVGSGTSYSAALTSGVMALMADVAIRRGVQNRAGIALAASQIVQDTAAPLPGSASGGRAQGDACAGARNDSFGCGRVDAGEAVAEMARWADAYVRRYGGVAPTAEPGRTAAPPETPEIGIFDTPDPATTPTATHIPAVQTALARIYGTPTPTLGPPGTPDAEQTEISRILTEIAPADPTSVAATLTAVARIPEMTLTALAPTPSLRDRAFGTATAAAQQTAVTLTPSPTMPPPAPGSVALSRAWPIWLPRLSR